MKIKVGAVTDIGLRRKKNEDNLCVDVEIGLLAVADGVGGAAFGEVASKMAVDIIKDYINKSKKKPSAKLSTNILNEAIIFSNKIIYEAAHSNNVRCGMSTTVAAALLINNRLSLAHAGDSRIYLIRNGLIEQLTDDHTVDFEAARSQGDSHMSQGDSHMSQGDSQNQDIMTYKETPLQCKLNSANVITRALGIAPDIEPSINEMTIFDGDILLLCTDGLNKLLSDNEITETIKTSKVPIDACNRLVDMANAKGGYDNITIILAFITQRRRFPFLHNFFKGMLRFIYND